MYINQSNAIQLFGTLTLLVYVYIRKYFTFDSKANYKF